MDHQQLNFNNTVDAHTAYQQVMSKDEKGEVEGIVSSPYQIPVASMSSMVGPPRNIHPGGQEQAQTFHGVALNGTHIHLRGYGHQRQSSYPSTPNNSQGDTQLYHGHSAPRYRQNHPALEGDINQVIADQRGKYRSSTSRAPCANITGCSSFQLHASELPTLQLIR
jgi:hypothetical protein